MTLFAQNKGLLKYQNEGISIGIIIRSNHIRKKNTFPPRTPNGIKKKMQ